MRTPESVYRGEVLPDGTFCVTVDHRPLVPRKLPGRSRASAFAWGYSGEGPTALAYALVLDATGDAYLAAVSCKWVQWALCYAWRACWQVTAGDVARWVEKWRKEARSLRLTTEQYDWVAQPTSSAPALAAAVGSVPPAPRPRPERRAGRIRLYPEPPAIDAPEGGGV